MSPRVSGNKRRSNTKEVDIMEFRAYICLIRTSNTKITKYKLTWTSCEHA